MRACIDVRSVLATAALCVLASTCWSQAQGIAGTYRARFSVPPDGGDREARLVLAADGSGSWRVLGGVRSGNPCAGRETPVSTSDVSDKGFTLHYHGSRVMSGCGDATWTIQRIDDKTFSGVMGDGRPLTLVRE